MEKNSNSQAGSESKYYPVGQKTAKYQNFFHASRNRFFKTIFEPAMPFHALIDQEMSS